MQGWALYTWQKNHIGKNVANSCIIGQFCTARAIAFKGMVKAGKYN
jgi:hypothetical protein